MNLKIHNNVDKKINLILHFYILGWMNHTYFICLNLQLTGELVY